MTTAGPASSLRGVCLRAYAAAAVLRAIAAARAGSLVPDGAVELETARALAEGRWADALDTRFHPLFAALVAPFVRAGLPAEATATVVTTLASALVAPLAAWTAARLTRGSLRAAALAGLIAAAQPWLVRLGGQVMAYGAAHAALALALALTVAAAQRPTAARALLAGGAVGLGWLARSDALATGAGLALALVAGVARRGGARPAARVAAALLVGALVVMSPYLVAMRAHTGEWRLSLKKRVEQVVRVPDAIVSGPRSGSAPATPDSPELRALVLAELTGGDVGAALQGARDTRPPLLEAAWFAARKALSAAHPLLLLLAVVGLVRPPLEGRPETRYTEALNDRLAGPTPVGGPRLGRGIVVTLDCTENAAAEHTDPRRHRQARGADGKPRSGFPAAPLAPGRWLAPAALGAFVAAHVLLKANWGYTSVLHQSAAGVLVAPLAGIGAARAWTWLESRTDAAPRRCGLAALLGLAALTTLTLKALEPQQRGKAVERQVGPWLRADAGPGPLVIAGHDARVVAHDADAAYVDLRDVPGPPAQAVAALRARGARYVVVFLRRRSAPADGAAPGLEAALTPLGVVPAGPPFRGNGEGGVSYDWRLFRICPDPRG